MYAYKVYIVACMLVYVTRFSKTSLVSDKAHFSSPLNCYTNELMIHVCIIAKDSLVWFSWGYFLRPIWCAWVLRWSLNGSGVTGQVSTQLEISTRWSVNLAIKLATICVIYNSNETIWQCSACIHRKTCCFIAPYNPWPPSLRNHFWYWFKKLSKMIGNSASCALQSWSTERDCITMNYWRKVCKHLLVFLRYIQLNISNW